MIQCAPLGIGACFRRQVNRNNSTREPGNKRVPFAYFRMPRYFFDIHHDTIQLDDQGEELPDQYAAWKEATVMAGQILQGMDGGLKPGHDWRMDVADEFRNTLFVLHIAARQPRS